MAKGVPKPEQARPSKQRRHPPRPHLNNIWRVHILSTISADTQPTLVVEFENSKYLFGTPENTARTVNQSSRKLRETRCVFLSGIDTTRTAGLPSILMSLADIGSRKVDFVGPPGTSHLIAVTRSFARRQAFTANIIEIPRPIASAESSAPSTFAVPPAYSDGVVNVWAAKLEPERGEVTMSSDLEVSAGKRKREASPESPSKRVDAGGEEGTEPSPKRPPSFRRELARTDLMQGEEAHAWRQSMVAATFTGGSPVLDRSLPRPQQKEGWWLPLPKFTPDDASFPRNSTLSYVLAGSRIRGKFNAEVAAKLAIPGHLRGDLTEGKTISYKVKDADGNLITREVKPEEVMGVSECPSVVVVLDVPTPAHIPSLLAQFCGTGESRPFLAQFRSKTAEDRENYRVNSVYHNCGKGVLEDPRYQEFMAGFHDETAHVVTSPEYAANLMTFTDAAYSTLRLNALDPSIFPLPHYSLQGEKSLDSIPGLPPKTTLMRGGDVFGIRPATGLEPIDESLDRFHLAASKPLELSEDTHQRFIDAKKEVEDLVAARAATAVVPSPGDDVTVVPTGTGSASSTRSRNVLGNLVVVPGHGNFLLDAGEGTYGQLKRHYGPAIDDVMRNLKLISISHLHADHHLGLPGLLAARRRLDPPPTEPLYLLGTRQVMKYLCELDDLDDLGISDQSNSGVVPLLNEVFLPMDAYHAFAARSGRPHWREPWLIRATSKEVIHAMYEALGLESIDTVKVNHTSICYGISIKHKDGWKIVFSGDTTPTESLVEVGKDATLLIHEASMSEDQKEMAAAKKHSTIGEAMEVATKMKAKNVLLTHFSTRYPDVIRHKREKEKEAEAEDDVPMAFASDLASYRIGDLWKNGSYMRAIDSNYRETARKEEEDEEAEMLDREDGT